MQKAQTLREATLLIKKVRNKSRRSLHLTGAQCTYIHCTLSAQRNSPYLGVVSHKRSEARTTRARAERESAIAHRWARARELYGRGVLRIFLLSDRCAVSSCTAGYVGATCILEQKFFFSPELDVLAVGLCGFWVGPVFCAVESRFSKSIQVQLVILIVIARTCPQRCCWRRSG